PPTPPLPTQQEQDLEDLQAEIEAYPALVKAGGRPPYPFHLLNEIFHHPEQYLEDPQYHDIILFWRGRVLHEEEKTPLCACHLLRWNKFRRLQRTIRERSIQSEWTLISAADWDTWGAFIERYGQKEGSWGFPEYTERIKKRLSKYGFTRPFELESDVSRQDSITTWIEYLAYEHWFYDQHASYIKRFQREHDEAWKKLVDSGVLRPGESYDIVCDIESVFKDAAENEQAKRAVQSTTAALLAAEVAVIKSCASQDVRDADERRLSAAQASRDKAEADYQSLMRRKSLKVIAAEDLEDLQHPDTDFPAVCGSAIASVEKAPADSAGARQGKRKRSRCEAIDVHQRLKKSRITSQGDLETCLSNRTADATGGALDAVEGTMNIGGREGGPEDGKASCHESRHARTKSSALASDQAEKESDKDPSKGREG
ncbi:hypothetical protein B0A55_13382, partial [Friedmanniomyces simplex]